MCSHYQRQNADTLGTNTYINIDAQVGDPFSSIAMYRAGTDLLRLRAIPDLQEFSLMRALPLLQVRAGCMLFSSDWAF